MDGSIALASVCLNGSSPSSATFGQTARLDRGGHPSDADQIPFKKLVADEIF
jgi:hypothetical protein